MFRKFRHFFVGENDYQALIKKFPAQKNKIYKIGNTRIDILKKPYLKNIL